MVAINPRQETTSLRKYMVNFKHSVVSISIFGFVLRLNIYAGVFYSIPI